MGGGLGVLHRRLRAARRAAGGGLAAERVRRARNSAQFGAILSTPAHHLHRYQASVVSYLLQTAAAGRTPNPDILCNSRIKFGVFHERVGRHFAAVASGHYARTSRDPPPLPARHSSIKLPAPVQLLRAVDDHKDQTYFLSQLAQPALAHALFPVGGYAKAEVRALAERHRLPTMKRKDSQGICFLGQLDYDSFLRARLGEAPGPVYEHESGELIGEHRGLWFHTVGQRRGLGPVLSNAHRARGPWHVVRKDVGANALHATRDYAAASLPRDRFATEEIHWVAGAPPAEPGAELQLQVKTRHGEACHEGARVTLGGAHGERALVQLAGRDKGLAPGQFAAFYDGEICLGSGVIDS